MASSHNETSALLDLEGALTNRYYRLSVMKVREVSGYLGLVVPLLVSVYYAWVRNQRHLLDQLRKHLLRTLNAIMVNRPSFNIISGNRDKERQQEGFTCGTGEVLEVSTAKFDVLLSVIRPGSGGGGREVSGEEEEELVTGSGEPSVECRVLADPGPGRREADVIFVHGLKGALEKTWTQGGGLGTKCWPRDWLPEDCPTVRIIALNYTTDPYLWRPFWVAHSYRTPMLERSWEMIKRLKDLGVGEHTIIWVGHSKGGLYVKQVLVNACETLEESVRSLGTRTKGVLFYSVPHRGSSLASLSLPLLRRSIELTEVQKNCAEVLTLHEKFKNLVDTEQLKLNVKSFIETQLTLMSFIYVRIVSQESADAQVGEMYGVPLDHRNICKPKSRECSLYKELVNLIGEVCGDLPTM